MARQPPLIARLPVRVRVALAFTAVMTVLLVATGLFLYLRLGSTLNDTIDRGLRSRAGDLTALVQQADSGLSEARRSPLTERGENLSQILDLRGHIVDAPPGLRDRPLLTAAELRRARRRTIVLKHDSSPADPSEPNRVRLLATPVRAEERHVVLVVGASLETTEAAQRQLGQLLLIGGPIALLLASLAGYGAAAGALRPVELMRRRAREIQASRPGMRLPVAPARDEVSRLGATLNEMLVRLEDAFARERAFVADASHELRTPLTIVKGELELALRDATDVAEFRAAVASAAEETDRVVQLAEDLLVIARLDRDHTPVRLEELAVADTLGATRRRFAQRAAERGAVVRVDAPADLALQADRTRVEQALANLVDNALRHGGRQIELAAVGRGDRVELHVLDDGPGFGEPFLAHAFERFSRADAARGRGGTGLGLAIVSAIAEAHGGGAHAANRASGGADVWIELPRNGRVTAAPPER